ncbi:hypothetical protein [Euzebya tangerina]|uniref:hypothetical protein n=1 Tax=Euzebya tangerina TaxID=591198 RepID=UPI0013C2BC7B|nr:hypothetical protein [Euzebya tangerina]
MRSTTALALFLLLVGACSSGSEIPDWALAPAQPTADTGTGTIDELATAVAAPSPAVEGVVLGTPAPLATPTPAPTPTPTATPSPPSEVRTVTFDDGERVQFTTEQGDLSWTLAVASSRAAGQVSIIRVRAPDGETLYLADPDGDLVLVDTLHPSLLSDSGAVGLFVTGEEGQSLPIGRWEVDVTGASGGRVSQVAITSGSFEEPQVMDIAVWGTVAIEEIPDIEALQNGWRISMSEVLSPHRLGIGRLDLVPAGDAGAPFATLDVGDPAQLRAACTAASETIDPAPGTALVVLVESLTGLTDAEAGAPSAIPGTSYLGPASHGCAIVPAGDVAAEQGVVALHQILHQAGLAQHTTARDGLTFDDLSDTPECPLREADRNADLEVSAEECAAGGGAENVMFWADGAELEGPRTLTPGQAARVRAHPLTHS